MSSGLPISDEEQAEEIVSKFMENDMVPDDVAEEVSELLDESEPIEALKLTLEARKRRQ